MGSGPVEEALLLLEAELLWVLLPDCDAATDGVRVTTTADVNVDSTRPEASVTPVVKEVERMREVELAAEPPEPEAEPELEATSVDDDCWDWLWDWLWIVLCQGEGGVKRSLWASGRDKRT